MASIEEYVIQPFIVEFAFRFSVFDFLFYNSLNYERFVCSFQFSLMNHLKSFSFSNGGLLELGLSLEAIKPGLGLLDLGPRPLRSWPLPRPR